MFSIHQKMQIMRLAGTLVTWNDDRGFGFIALDRDQSQIFVHISAFPACSGRPKVQQWLTFEIEQTAEGKQRAKNIELYRPEAQKQATREPSSAPASSKAWYVLGAFLLLWCVMALSRTVWPGFFPPYVLMSVLCFAAYAFDKRAAETGAWRTSENSLILLGLACGWPGAICAQQVFRHKTSKQVFQQRFWVSVVLNIVVFIVANYLWLTWPLAR